MPNSRPCGERRSRIGAQLAPWTGRRIADRDPSCAPANGGAGAGGARRARSTASAGQTAARTAPTVRGLQDSLGGGAYKTSIRIRRRGQVRWWSATARASRAQSRTRGRGAAHVPPPRRRDGTGGVYVAPLSGRRWRSGPSAARGLEQEYARARGPACFVLVSAGKQAGAAASPARQASGLHRSTHVPVPPPAVGAPPASGCPPYSIRAGP